MSRKRHILLDRRARRGAAVTTLSWTYPPGYRIPEHLHDTDQLVYAVSGVMTVSTSGGSWVIPPHRAVWIPADVPHSILISGTVVMRTLYLRRGLVRAFSDCAVLNVSALLRELVLHACGLGALAGKTAAERRLLGVLLDQLRELRSVPLRLPLPSDARALAVARSLLDSPEAAKPFAALCAEAGASKRTIERVFQSETGMSAGRWRQQARLLAALRDVAAGKKVTEAALGAGYQSPSAFIAMFKKALGTTPARYFRGPGADAPTGSR